MSSIESLKKCFTEALGLPAEQVQDSLAYNSVKEWDSVGHMALVAAIEAEFNIMMDTDDIIGMSDVATIKTILAKYGVTFS